LKRFILFLIAVLCIILLIWQTDYVEIISGLKNLNPWILFYLISLQILTIFLVNFQWYKISDLMNEKVKLRTLFHVNMVGTFVESITPSAKAGGEATKVYLLKSQAGLSTSKATALVGIQKTFSLAAFLFLNFVSIGWFVIKVGIKSSQLEILLFSFIFLFLILILLLTLILYPRKLGKIIKFLPNKRNIRTKVENFIIAFEKEIKNLLKLNEKLLYQIILSLFIWILFAYKTYIITKGLNIELSFISSAVITYLTYMVGMLPLLPGGIGTFEASMTLFLIPMGISYSKGMLLALILRFVTFWFVFILSGLYIVLQEILNLIRGDRLAKQ